MNKITIHKAKKIIKEVLDTEGLNYTKVTAKTVNFSSLRGSGIFVKIHGWTPNPSGSLVRKTAKDNGFFVEFTNCVQ